MKRKSIAVAEIILVISMVTANFVGCSDPDLLEDRGISTAPTTAPTTPDWELTSGGFSWAPTPQWLEEVLRQPRLKLKAGMLLGSSGPGSIDPYPGLYTCTSRSIIDLKATPTPTDPKEDPNEFAFWYAYENQEALCAMANPCANETSIFMNGEYHISASFRAPYKPVPENDDVICYVSVTSGRYGKVKSPTGEECDYYCYHSHYGENTTLEAVPDTGCEFVYWSGGALQAIEDPCAAVTTLNVRSCCAGIKANFRPKGCWEECELTITSGDPGDVTSPGEGTFTYPEGALVYLSAVATTDAFCFHKWTAEDEYDVHTIDDVDDANTFIRMYGNYTINAGFITCEPPPDEHWVEWNPIPGPAIQPFADGAPA